jgi:chromate transporter
MDKWDMDKWGWDGEAIWGLIRIFVPLSLLAIGGAPSILAEMEHQTVDVYGWLTQRDFVDLFAISRAAPGPGTLIITLIGWKAAGLAGAIAASAAFYLPTSLIVYGVASVWGRYRSAVWRQPVEQGLAPIAIGLIFSGAYAVLQSMTSGLLSFGTTAIAVALLLWRPVNPILLLSAAALIYGAIYAFA